MAARDELLEVRVLLRDARRYQADARASAVATGAIGEAARRLGGHLDFAATRAFLMRQAMFTLRRVIYSATLTIAGAAAAVVRFGFAFNSGMEQSQIAFTQFLGSTRLARRELNTLFQLAATTPFNVSNIRAAATEFLGFGFNVQQTNRYLKILGDVVSGLPQLGQEGIGRLAVVFGQIRASGRLLGQDLLQLTQAGIPAIEILTKQLQLSRGQVQDLLSGNLRIPSNVAIPALMRGLQERFGGLARRQAQSFQGLTSTAQDYFSQLSGILTHPLFVRSERMFRQTINPLLTQLTKAFQRKPGGDWQAFFQTLDRGVGTNGRLYDAWRRLSTAGHDLMRIVRQSLIPALRSAWTVASTLFPVFTVLGGVLAFAAHHTTLLRIAITVWLSYMVVAKGVVLALRLGMTAYAFAVRVATIATRAYTAATNIALLAQWLFRGGLTATYPLLIAQYRMMIATTLVAARMRAAMLIASLGALGVVGVVVAIAAALLVLYLRVGIVHRAVNNFVRFLLQNRRWTVAAIPIFGPMILAATEIRRHWDGLVSFVTTLPGRIASAARGMWDGIREAFRDAINWIIRGWNRLHFTIPGFSLGPIHVPGFNLGLPPLPTLGDGGHIRRGGSVVVGERGMPEVVNLPRGASVEPLSRGPAGGGSLDEVVARLGDLLVAVQNIRGNVYLDGKPIGEAAWGHKATVEARA